MTNGSDIRWMSHQSKKSHADVNGLGIDERMPAYFVDRPAGLPEYLLVHFHDSVSVRLNDVIVTLPAHTFVIWPPHVPHYFGSTQPWAHSWMICSGSRLKACITASGLGMQTPIPQFGAETSFRYLRLIHGEAQRLRNPDPLLIEGFLSLWLREIFRDAHQDAPDDLRIPVRMLEAKHHIDSHLDQPLSLRQIAAVANLSVSRFSAEFVRCFGCSPIAYTVRLRMKRALYHLSDRNLSIKEVARRCGFTDQHYFSRQFRAHMGKTPREFR